MTRPLPRLAGRRCAEGDPYLFREAGGLGPRGRHGQRRDFTRPSAHLVVHGGSVEVAGKRMGEIRAAPRPLAASGPWDRGLHAVYGQGVPVHGAGLLNRTGETADRRSRHQPALSRPVDAPGEGGLEERAPMQAFSSVGPPRQRLQRPTGLRCAQSHLRRSCCWGPGRLLRALVRVGCLTRRRKGKVGKRLIGG